MSWTSPEDLTAQVRRLWDQGRLLSCALSVESAVNGADRAIEFPLPLKLRRPSARELGERFDAVRSWIEALESGSRSKLGAGYEIVWVESNNRQLGRNRRPIGVRLPTYADALTLIGKSAEAALFDELAALTLERFPVLGAWLARNPLTVLDYAADWGRILACLTWFRDHPRPGVYARQIDVTGIDSKFIEARKGLLSELLDLVLPAQAIEASATGSGKGFEARYGLLAKPSLVRFRILDEARAIAGLTDVTVPADQFAALSLDVSRVFVVENEITGLAFPPMPDSMLVLGLGHAVNLIAAARWLADCEVHYWGDLDTHGFAMLDRLRASLPHVRSLLMDRATLLAHRPLWTTEEAPHIAPLERLTPEEAALYADLRYDRLGRAARLEQERISFGWLRRVLNTF